MTSCDRVLIIVVTIKATGTLKNVCYDFVLLKNEISLER